VRGQRWLESLGAKILGEAQDSQGFAHDFPGMSLVPQLPLEDFACRRPHALGAHQ